MWRTVLILLLASVPPVLAQDRLSPAGAADRVVVCIEAGDDAALAALATRLSPDPWLVADVLCARGAFDAAERLAKSADAPGVRGLARFVASQRESPTGESARRAFANALRRYRAKDPQASTAAIDAVTDLRDDVISVRLRHQRGNNLRAMRRYPKAAEEYVRAADRAARMGWVLREANLSFLVGRSLSLARDPDRAIAAFERARRGFRTLRFFRELGLTSEKLGVLRRGRGRLRASADDHREAIRAYTSMGSGLGVANNESHLGATLLRRGDLAAALTALERAEAGFAELAEEEARAKTLQNIGVVWSLVGDNGKAHDRQQEALAIFEEQGLTERKGLALLSLGAVERRRGRLDSSDAYLTRARDLAEKSGNELRRGLAIGSLAENALLRGRKEMAVARFREALRIGEKIGDGGLEALAGLSLGGLALDAGEPERAAGYAARIVAAAEESESGWALVKGLTLLSRVRLREGKPREAVEHARRSVRASNRFVEDLSSEYGARAREMNADVYRAGVAAALALESAEDLWFFVESGRAGALLEALGGRESLRAMDVPPELTSALAAAGERLGAAAKALEAARAGERRAAIRGANREHALAQAAHADLLARVERRKQQAAAAAYPEPAAMADVKALLPPGRALALYVLADGIAAALVLTRESARIVELGGAKPLIEACAALRVREAEVEEVTPAAAALRKVLVTPLGLSGETRSLLVSPDGPIAFVPFSLLAPRLEVNYVPSGSALVALARNEAPGGRGVLALGAPEYPPGRGLSPLPSSGREASAVGTRTLLGGRATEAALREALLTAGLRWRAVHLAAHGLVDRMHPSLSALALTQSGDDDGLLTAREASELDISADLVTLSACNSGRGRFREGEGLTGLVRGLTIAGSPRVLASLWKVDDEATRVLMERFYGSWLEKGMSPTAALRDAQASLRATERFRHPRYWAAWVLWGLS